MDLSLIRIAKLAGSSWLRAIWWWGQRIHTATVLRGTSVLRTFCRFYSYFTLLQQYRSFNTLIFLGPDSFINRSTHRPLDSVYCNFHFCNFDELSDSIPKQKQNYPEGGTSPAWAAFWSELNITKTKLSLVKTISGLESFACNVWEV